jgi:hypothetical protein
MGDWLRYLRLTARAKTGVNSNVIISGAAIVWAAMAIFLWLSITIFLAVAHRVWPWDWHNQWVFAASMLTLGWLVVMLLLVGLTMFMRYRAKQRAEAALAAHKAALFDPSMVTVALEVGRAIGWRRVISLAGVVLLASGLAKEWMGREEGEPPVTGEEED